MPPWSRLRLTVRGRVVLVLVLLAAALALFTLGRTSASSASTPVSSRTATVQSGDTLWSFAARVAPHSDPRATVSRLMAVNHVAGGTLRPGQRLRLPG